MLFFIIIIIVIILYYCTCYKLDSVERYKDYTKSKNYQELDKPDILPYEQVLVYYNNKVTRIKSILKKMDPCDLIIRADKIYCAVENIKKFHNNDEECQKDFKNPHFVNKKYKEYYRKYTCENVNKHREIDKEINWSKVQTELIEDIVKYRQLLLKTDKNLYKLEDVYDIIDIKDLEAERRGDDFFAKRTERWGLPDGSCFTTDNQIIPSILSEKSCPKPHEWSNRCKTDSNCSFTNKNYKNELGGCSNNGYCGIPIGIKQKGYNTNKSIIKDIDKAECHNCNKSSDKNCCKEQLEQLDNTKMNSPDYAFKNDRTTRLMDKMNLTLKDLKVSTIFIH